MPGRKSAIFMLTLACVVWGLSFVFIKQIDRALGADFDFPFFTAAAWTVSARFLFAFALLALWPGILKGLTRPVLRDGFYLALPSVLGYGLQAAGMRGLDPGVNAFLTSLYTPLTPLFGWLLFRRAPALRVLAAVPVALAGVTILSRTDSPGTGLPGGLGISEALVVAGAFCWAIQILLIDRLARRHAPGPFSAALFLSTGLMAIAALLPLNATRSPASLLGPLLRTDLILPLWGLVLLSTIFTLVVLMRFQPVLDPSRAALLYMLEPAFAAGFAWLIENEQFGTRKLLGCALLLAANALVEVRLRARPTSSAPPRP